MGAVACGLVAPETSIHQETSDRLARRALFAFALTFILSRAVVFLMLIGKGPE
jgi:hypothetical protein